MLNRELIDKEFPTLKDVVFMNAALVVIPPLSAQEAYFGFTREYIKNFSEGVVSGGWERVAAARESVAELIGAKAGEIGFVKNTAEGVGIIAGGYPFEPGDNVILLDQEHPANLFAWINLQNKGVDLRVVPSGGGDLEEEIIARIDANTKAVTVSAVQFSTGYRADLARLGRVCREKDILFVVDGIQAVGRLVVDVKKYNIDYLACGGHKGLLGTLGAGFVYCSERIVEKVIPPYACYQSVQSYVKPPALTTDFSKIVWHDDSRRFEAGNLNYAGIAAIGAGTRLLNTLGIGEIEKHILNLEEEFLDELNGLPLEFRSPKEKAHRSGIPCIYYPLEKEEQVKEILDKYRVYVTMRGGYIRASMNFYNTREQIARAVSAFKEIAGLSA
jgi:cysteine desulfurase/selenocysteine lyase